MHVMVLTYGEPKKGYLNFTLGNLWATQPIVLLNLATLGGGYGFFVKKKDCLANI